MAKKSKKSSADAKQFKELAQRISKLNAKIAGSKKSPARRRRAPSPPPPPIDEFSADFKIPKSFADKAEREYWREFARLQKQREPFTAESLKPYETPPTIERTLTFRRPLTDTQRKAVANYQKWLRSQPDEPLTPEERKARELKARKAAYQAAYSEWNKSKPNFPGFDPEPYKDIFVRPRKSSKPKNKR